MKASMLGLMVATAAFGASSVYLWRQLDQERARSSEVEQATQKLQARITELESARHTFTGARLGFDGGAAGMPAMPPHPSRPPSAMPVGTKTAEVAAPELSPWTIQRHEPPPAMKRMMRASMRSHNRRMYADVGDALGLDKETATKLVDLITEQQTAGIDVRATDPTEPAPDWDAIHRQQEKAIADLIGPDKMVSLEQYQQSMPARQDFAMLAQQLEGSDVPLTQDQGKKLLEAYVTERARVPMPTYTEGSDGADYAKAINAWQADYSQRVSDEATRILNADQLSAYNDIQQWQKEMREQLPTMLPAGPHGTLRGPRGALNATYVDGVVTNAGAGTVELAVAAPTVEKPRKQ
jgi:hypothetical protein